MGSSPSQDSVLLFNKAVEFLSKFDLGDCFEFEALLIYCDVPIDNHTDNKYTSICRLLNNSSIKKDGYITKIRGSKPHQCKVNTHSRYIVMKVIDSSISL